MKKMKKWLGGILTAIAVAVAPVTHAAPDYTGLGTAITEGATAVAAVAGAAIVAGFGIFVLIWGARKIKGALSSGG